jgi:hypothetical protein
MASTIIYTYSDVVEHLLDWVGVTSTDAVLLRKVKRAIEAAYREMPNLKNWTYYMVAGARLSTVASYNTGTIAYTNSTRTVTLTSGTWPTWAKYGVLRIADVDYEVESRESSTSLTLSINKNPGADVSSGTSYLIYRDTYPLPVNFAAMGMIRDAENSTILEYVAPSDFVMCRPIGQSPTQPLFYTVVQDHNYVGSMAIRFPLPPDAIYNFDYTYRRIPRQLLVYTYSTGSVTTSGVGVTGTGTTWTRAMCGCVIRFTTSTTTAVTGTSGTNPYTEMRMITEFTNATTLEIDQALNSDLTGVKYEISDPIDIESGAMYTAFLRRCECELGKMLNRSDVPRLESQQRMSDLVAMESDNRIFDERPSGGYWQRVPQTWTITNDTD